MKRRMWRAAIAITASAQFLPSPVGAATDIEVVDAVASPGDELAAVYFSVTGFDAEDALIAVTSDVGEATMHITDVDDGVTTMRRVDRIAVQRGSEIRFTPGGTHVMLEALREPLVVGDQLELKLEFERGAALVVPLSVVAIDEIADRQADEAPPSPSSSSARDNDQTTLMVVTAVLTLGFILVGGTTVWWRGQGKRTSP